MIDHPLFNFENPDDAEKRKRNIAYINIMYCEPGKKKITLTNQWEPEELLTPAQVLEAVGGVEGTYELIGRGPKHSVVDRQYLTLGVPKGAARPAQAAAPPAAANAPSPSGVFSTPMQAGGLLIPSNMDPTTAMIISMMALQNQQNAQNAAAQQQQAQFQMQQIVTMMGASQASTTSLIGTLATAFAPVLASHAGAPTAAPGSSEAGFLKGIEIMAALKEGVDQAKNGAGQADWGTITSNVLKSFQSLAEVAKTTASAAPPPAPVVPPGGPIG